MSASASVTSILNLRDAGATVNNFLGARRLREGLLFRSARPDEASSEDRDRLKNDIGIKTVVDLRTKTEHLKQMQKRQPLHQPGPVAAIQTNDDLAQSVKIPGLHYVNVSLAGKGLERHLAWQLSWWNLFQLIFYHIIGQRVKVMAIMGREVLQVRGLVGLGLDTLDYCHGETVQVLRTFLDQEALPSLVHCTQGKDRTGLIIALVLMILDVPIPAIEHDYALTDAALNADRDVRFKEIQEVGLSQSWGRTDPNMIKAIAEHITTHYGGLDQYLDLIGFGQDQRDRLRELLLY
ncbi:hypothetical protein BN1708_005766 [Verticillium longisporum]|uniref:Tyrosine specific protein phosphatases domain-containing protein n=1 Tax=Verticillium longisporum TaxID=100787 RepID=A0A0G4MDR0_VERLO|nr:hypothetical protein BN1708_005766 [Verticillium longisporum]